MVIQVPEQYLRILKLTVPRNADDRIELGE